jgi:CheY-like chemotaxis protein
MQGWDGLKLMNEVRSRNFGNIAIILMSGAVTREQLEVAAKNKADGILIKPLSKDVLLAKVADVVARRKNVF